MYGEYESETLEKLHNAELSMLKDFAKLCDDNNIEYSVEEKYTYNFSVCKRRRYRQNFRIKYRS